MFIYTLQMSKWRSVPQDEYFLIDVTIKSLNEQARRLFAPPSSKLVYGLKQGHITTSEFSEIYLSHLKETSTLYFDEWKDFITKGPEKAILMCYCSPGSFCHRHLLADYLERFSLLIDETAMNFGEFSLDSINDERMRYVYGRD